MEANCGGTNPNPNSVTHNTNTKVKLHAIVYAWPGQGHLNPLLRFSELLAEAGCDVTFVHSQFNLARLEKAAAHLVRQPDGSNSVNGRKSEPAVRFVGIDDGLPSDHPRDIVSLIQATDGTNASLSLSFEEFVRQEVWRLQSPAVAGSHVSENSTSSTDSGTINGTSSIIGCNRNTINTSEENSTLVFIVSDFFMAFTQDVANKFGLPRLAVYIQSAASFVLHLLVNDGFRPSADEDGFLSFLEGIVPSTMRPNEMISFLQSYDPKDPMVDYMLRSFKRINEPTKIILNTFYDLEPKAIDYILNEKVVKNIECVGPLLPLSCLENNENSNVFVKEALWEEDHECLEWLNKQPIGSILFISFGSLATFSLKQVHELAFGLENSMIPFLWAIRSDFIEDGGGLPEGFVERVHDRAFFVSWAPQTRVLKHPSIGGFLTHCGWNSVLESITIGVPMLGWSSFADQMLNCRCIIDLWRIGMCISCSNEFVSRDEIEEKVRSFMQQRPRTINDSCRRLKEDSLRAIKERKPLLSKLVNVTLKRNNIM